MKPLRIKIQDEASEKKVPQHVVEKDYALSYVLAGIAKQPELSHSLIFKGGTALKKIFFVIIVFLKIWIFRSLMHQKIKTLRLS